MNFYGQSVKPPTQPLDKKATKPPDSGSVTSVKRPAACVRGKCVPHSEERFRVEVGYNAELITVFKNIASRNYGELWALMIITFRKSLTTLMTLFSCYAVNVKESIWHYTERPSSLDNVSLTSYCFVTSIADPATKMWNFSLVDYKQLSRSLLHSTNKTLHSAIFVYKLYDSYTTYKLRRVHRWMDQYEYSWYNNQTLYIVNIDLLFQHHRDWYRVTV